MKIAIHHRPGSFSDDWIEYCKENNIDYKIVDAFNNDIIEQVQDCSAFIWHHHHAHLKDIVTAKRILFALEHSGLIVFPNFHTGWHFDDKVAQKYLLESLNIPMVKSYVFYEKAQALQWARETNYPKVFKLKGGAASTNVRLVKNSNQAIKIINRAFNKGFPQYNKISNLADEVRNYRSKDGNINNVIKSMSRLLIEPSFSKHSGREYGYVYFQDFIPNNDFDIRIIVIGNKAIAAKRFVRENDFRASGSGKKDFGKNAVQKECISLAFDIAKKLQTQSISFDFIYSAENKPLVVEISYGFPPKWPREFPGYWDANLQWHEGTFIHPNWILNDIIQRIMLNKNRKA